MMKIYFPLSMLAVGVFGKPSMTPAPRFLDQFSTGLMIEDGVKTGAAPECRDGLGWVYYNGHCYMFNR